MARQPRGFLQEASHQVVAGGSAGLVEICLMHPLDVVKTRFQIQRGKTDPTSYKSLGDCFRTIFQREGLLGFYKGILPPVLAETPKRAVKFFTFEQYKKLLGYVSLPPGLAFAVAGLGSGLTEAVVVNPFEVVKVTLQTNQNAFAEQPSSFVQAQQIIKTGGLGSQGLNKGLTATLGRHGVFNMVYFGFYFNVKNILPVNKISGSVQRLASQDHEAGSRWCSDAFGLRIRLCVASGHSYSQVALLKNVLFKITCILKYTIIKQM
ncbi:PREDICTED: mitochondrial 2-oxodicarboxylate carrier isoform X3 [Sturnus vulgaris]|uniref:mitochondrial 2-oxodicarboxylate carrier isoform X3 n=1 Tax=Sturnus vulgaris TaxID=9172 RepID=UPI00071A83D7|nr:PREDICTED: mitochondrial 2-oxodicarboxylate carrier isoform X3 [Sturnus vulgaris]